MVRATHDSTPAASPADSGTSGGHRRRRGRLARRVGVPTDLHPIASLDRIDYADAYRAPSVPRDHSAEAWLRTAFDDAPALGVRAARMIWRLVGAELAPDPSPGHIFGCRLTVHDEGIATMAVIWRVGLRATIVGRTDTARTGRNGLVMATFVHLETPASRRVWRVLAPVHRALAAGGLTLAAWRLARVGTTETEPR